MVPNALFNAAPNPTRRFGRFVLVRLLGRSTGSMLWLAFDPRDRAEVMLALPRHAPADAEALERWLARAGRAARLDHPNLAKVAELGVHDHWPFIVVDRTQGVTLAEWLDPNAHVHPTPLESVGWLCQVLQGLAYAHDAGVAHLDPQLHFVLIDERAGARLMALAAAHDTSAVAVHTPSRGTAMAMDPRDLRAHRDAASRDLLACGVLLHGLLAGQPALDESDPAAVIARIQPPGGESAALPWTTPAPIPDALRAIADRCTTGQERLRYQSIRTLLGALLGWLEIQSNAGGGPVGTLLDRLDTVGHLPALPGLAARVARITSAESQRTDEIAGQVLDDMALSFELLRTLNSAQVQGTQVQGNGPVLTLRRIISLIGVNGVRLAANALKPWPGPLSEPHAAALQATLDRVRLAGHTAQALRPKGYDAQVVFLVALLQNLGRLMLRYHFADEAEQIALLMQPALASVGNGAPPRQGLSEDAAAYAVLGVDVAALGMSVAHHWGLDDEVVHMARRQAPGAPIRRPDNDTEILRLTASAANEAVDAAGAGARPTTASMEPIAQRYARALDISARDLCDALREGRDAMRAGALSPQPRRGDVEGHMPPPPPASIAAATR